MTTHPPRSLPLPSGPAQASADTGELWEMQDQDTSNHLPSQFYIPRLMAKTSYSFR